MQITHEEARTLIQFDADQALKMDQRTILRSHLEDCVECREYASRMESMTSMLSASMRRRWNRSYSPLPTAVLLPKQNSRFIDRIILATRIAAIGVMAIAFLFSVRHITGPVESGPGTVPVSAPPIPTPSIQSTSTKILQSTCGETLYVVRSDDTLESIADQFSVTKEEILSPNGIAENHVRAGMELIIQSCTVQPTGTFHATETFFIPLTSPTISTPGG